MGTETCPSCNNQGLFLAVVSGPNGSHETMRACDFCGGLGIVEVAAADRWRRGQALRQMRVHQRNLTQKGLAHILGISPQLLSDIERGRADMP
ncbi:MAG: helix-turn-helix domain-containing protein, partial [Deltaproteobacteria bacterium]|nr:helix-turn-helix domain-containing protein [Deltaproteobacteria bacterium]